MRVLFWVPRFLPSIGGIEVWSSRLMPALQQRGHEFLVLASRTSRQTPEVSSFGSIEVRKLEFEPALVRRDMSEIKKMLLEVGQIKRDFAPDLVHMNTSMGGAYFNLLTRNHHPVPELFTLHFLNQADRLESNSLMVRTLISAKWVAAVSRFMLDEGVRLAPDVSRRSSVVVNGLPWPGMMPGALPVDHPRLLVMGRAVAEKGFDIALAAFDTVRRRRPDARLTVAGSGHAMPELRQQAVDRGVADGVDFLGWIEPSAIPELINRASLVLVPSRWEEPFGLVALEAAQMGRPVVATDVGGLGEVVAHGETGLLVPREDPAAMAEAIVTLLADPERMQAMGQAGRERAATMFAFERMVDAYDALYAQVTAGGPQGRGWSA